MTLNFIGLLTLVVTVIINQLVGPKLVNLCDKLISYSIEISVFGVPFWALAYVFGKNGMWWYRLYLCLHQFSIVDTRNHRNPL